MCNFSFVIVNYIWKLKISIFENVFESATTFFLEVIILSIVLVGGLQLLKGEVTVDTMVAFLTILYILSTNLNKLNNELFNIEKGIVSGKRVFEILDTESKIKDDAEPIKKITFIGEIEFRNVYFSYNGEEILRNVNFKIKPKEIVALVGPSAVGKTTIADLIPRFYDPIKGSVLIDGIDIRKVKLEFLRKQIGIVHQETFLFNTSIRENIAYGKLDATDDEIVESAKIANAHDFILKLSQGYNTIISEQGVNLSGGEKQRIAIARAIIGKPRILILDEATSSLDAETEAIVQERLYQFIKENKITTT